MRLRAIAGAVFVTTMAIALLSPLEPASETSLTAHMVQHVLLIAVAAPALAATLPTARLTAARWYVVTALAVATQTVVVLAWHVPTAFDLAVQHEPLHGLEHVTMLAAAAGSWWVLTRTRELRGEAVIAVFLASLPLTVLGVGLLLSGTPWYAPYPDLVDQQVAGAVMWAIGGGITALEGVAVFAVWLHAADRPRSPSRPRRPPLRTRPSPAP